ncbi:MAG: AtpZ/AtpI family protein [Sphingomonadaceae bacterium]
MRNLRVWQAVAVASQLGFVLAAAVAIGLFAGWYLDSIMYTSPVFVVIGALIGMAAGLYSCARIVRDMQRSESGPGEE